MKKILVAALICAVSSFAAWDYFPVIEYGKGEAKVGFGQGRQGNDPQWGPQWEYFKIRYSPMQNLELLSQTGYTFGARFQIVPVLSAGIDIGFPIPGTAWSFTPNVQFSTPLTSALEFGSNFQITINTEDADKNARGIDLSTGVELDLTVGQQSTIWVGCDINKGLTLSKHDGKTPDGAKLENEDPPRGLEIVPSIGYVATVGNLSLGTNVGMEFGKDAGNEPFKTSIGMDFSIKF